MEDFFSVVSKGVVVVPILIIIASLIIKFNKPSKVIPIKTIISPTPTSKPVVVNKIKLDLVGPWVCRFKNNQVEYDLYIKNKTINLTTITNGNKKTINLTPYEGILENFLNLDINQLESMAKSYLPKGVDLKTLVNSCKKESF